MSKILITGGTGFIGANLVRKLYKKNKITIFSENTEHPLLKGLNIKRIKGDIRDYNAVLKVVKGCDHVYHLAACTLFSPEKKNLIFSVNIIGTENVMKACLKSKVKKVVYTSSGAVLGYNKREKVLTEKDNMDFIDNLYAQSKKLGEDKVQEYVKKGLNATIVLPGYVMGPGEVDKRRYELFKSIARNRIKFTFPGGGSTVDVEDIVDGLILAIKKGRAGQRYIISNEYLKLFDFYNLIARLLHKKKIRIRLPKISAIPMYILGVILKLIMKNPPLTPEHVKWHFNYRFYDSTKAKKELGWRPKFTLADSIKRTIKYYRSIGELK